MAGSTKDENELFILKEKKKLKRAFIFWDHANVFHILQELNIRLDYDLAKRRLAREYYLVAPIMYMGKPRVIFPKKQRFIDALEFTGWSITEKPLKIKPSGKRSQNGVDEIMFLNIYDFAEEGAYEKAIIVSGDKIFVGVVKRLKELKIKVDIWSFRKSISRALIKEAGVENIYYLDDILDEIKLDGK